MEIGVVGACGVVGGALVYGFEKLGHSVFCHDIRLDSSLSELREAEVIFICVPTPKNEDGSCNTSIVEDVVDTLIKNYEYAGIIAIKSTSTPGTTQRLIEKYTTAPRGIRRQPKICFVPEFLRERCAITDFTEAHDVLVIGTDSDKIFGKIVEAHGRYPKRTIMVSPTEAELAKYFNNVFCAMKVTFANGFYDVCNALGAKYSNVKKAMTMRDIINDNYLDCNENFRGYAGPCYLKDVPAFIHLVKELGVSAKLFETIHNDNKLYKKTVPDGMRLEPPK